MHQDPDAHPQELKDWSRAPARWPIVVVLSTLSIIGLAAALSRPTPAPVVIERTPDGGEAPALPAIARRIDVNTAPPAELELLPGIGPALAARIVEHRESQGRFGSVDDLQRVKGIGPKTVEKLRALASAS